MMSEYMDLGCFKAIYVVDLCGSLCRVVRGRERRGGVGGVGWRLGGWLAVQTQRHAAGFPGLELELCAHTRPRRLAPWNCALAPLTPHPASLRQAQQKVDAKGWRNVKVVEADACEFVPPEGCATLVTFSYSLSSEAFFFFSPFS